MAGPNTPYFYRSGSGGTGLTNPMTTGGDIIYGGSGGTPTRLANGSSSQYLKSTGGTTAPAWATFSPPTVQALLSTGTASGQIFTITSGNATVGATYTNNSITFTVLATIAAQTTVYMSGVGSPLASGTLTKATGSGDATLTFSAAQALATYSLPAGCLGIKVTVIGGGGGGGGCATAASSSSGGAGGGGAGAAVKYISSPASTYYYAVGTAGAGGTSGNNSGNPGLPSTFNALSPVIGGPGLGGSGGAAQTSFISVIQIAGGGGGQGSGGDELYPGSQGGLAMSFAIGQAINGYGGASVFGVGGAQLGRQNSSGSGGGTYGGGGSGGVQVNAGGNQSGSNGAAGAVIVEEYYS